MSRVSQLNDRDWLQERYRRVGDSTIAKELGCSESTVRRARRRLEIASFRVGPRSEPIISEPASPSLAALTFHFAEDHRHKSPPSREMLIARCQGWLDADRHHDHEASQHALLSMASGALLVHEHHAKLRQADVSGV